MLVSPICKACGTEKSLNGKGTKYYCKPCKAKSDKKYASENKEKMQTKKRKWYDENKEYVITKTKQRYQDNKDEILSKGKEKYHKTKIKKFTTDNFIELDMFNLPIENRQITLKSPNFKFKKQYRADAYDPKTNTIYEFFGDYWHGNPIKFKPNDINKKK